MWKNNWNLFLYKQEDHDSSKQTVKSVEKVLNEISVNRLLEYTLEKCLKTHAIDGLIWKYIAQSHGTNRKHSLVDKKDIEQKLYTVYLESMCKNHSLNLYLWQTKIKVVTLFDVFIYFKL